MFPLEGDIERFTIGFKLFDLPIIFETENHENLNTTENCVDYSDKNEKDNSNSCFTLYEKSER